MVTLLIVCLRTVALASRGPLTEPELPAGLQVAIPVYCLGPVGRYHSAHSSSPAAGAMATMAALANMTPQQQRAFELQRAHVVARQMFAGLVGGESTGHGSGMDRAGSAGKGPQPQGSGGTGMLLGPGVGPGLALLSQGSDRKDAKKDHEEQHAAARGPSRPALEPNLVRLVKSTDIGSVVRRHRGGADEGTTRGTRQWRMLNDVGHMCDMVEI